MKMYWQFNLTWFMDLPVINLPLSQMQLLGVDVWALNTRSIL